MIRIETPRCFYFDKLACWCDELRLKQLSINLSVLGEIISIVMKKAEKMMPSRPPSTVEPIKDKKAAEAAKLKE